MLDAIGAVLPFAIGVAISPLLLAGEILLLLSPRGPHHGPAFVIGWAGRLALANTVILVVLGPHHFTPQPGQDTTKAIIELVLGPALAVFAIHLGSAGRLPVSRLRHRSGSPSSAPLVP